MDKIMQDICERLDIKIRESAGRTEMCFKNQGYHASYHLGAGSEMLRVWYPAKLYMDANVFKMDGEYSLTITAVQKGRQNRRLSEEATAMMRNSLKKIIPDLKCGGLAEKIQDALARGIKLCESDPENAEMDISLEQEDLQHLPEFLYAIFQQPRRTTRLNLSAVQDIPRSEKGSEFYSQ